MANTFLELNLSRKEIANFQNWLRSLPRNDIMFLHQTFEPESSRVKKVKDLYQRYLAEKAKPV